MTARERDADDTPPGTPSGCERIAYVVVHREEADFMHPTGGGMYLPVVSGLADAGHHVIWANSRYRGTVSA